MCSAPRGLPTGAQRHPQSGGGQEETQAPAFWSTGFGSFPRTMKTVTGFISLRPEVQTGDHWGC